MLRRSPTQKIERLKRNIEHQLYKKSRENPKRVQAKANRESVIARTPKKGEVINIHNHDQCSKDRQGTLPSPEDIRVDLDPKVRKHNRTSFIAIRQGNNVMGYTAYRLPKNKSVDLSKYKKFFLKDISGFSKQERHQYETQEFKKAVSELKKQGIHIKFVPNKKRGCAFKNGLFTKP